MDGFVPDRVPDLLRFVQDDIAAKEGRLSPSAPQPPRPLGPSAPRPLGPSPRPLGRVGCLGTRLCRPSACPTTSCPRGGAIRRLCALAGSRRRPS